MKKLNKVLSIVLAMAMVLALTAITAFAEGTPNTAGTTTVKVTKEVTKAKGLTLADTVFTFKVDKISYDGSETDISGMPTIQGTTITVGSQEIYKENVYRIGTLDFSALAGPDVKPGVYVYEVSEEIPDPLPEGFTSYDTNKYTVSATRDANGNVTLTIQKNGTGEKLNATEEKDTPDDADGAKMTDTIFVNNYTKKATGTEDGKDDNASFVITKAVDAKYGDTTYEFPFTMTIDGTPEAVKKNPGTADEEDITSTWATGFNMKAGDVVAVYGLDVGATYNVTEGLRDTNDTEKKYVSSVDVLENNTKIDSKSTEYSATANKGKGAVVTAALVTEGNNKSAYLNTNQKATDDDPGNTGVLISNLPYIVLALVAVGGLVAYVVVRRKADDEA